MSRGRQRGTNQNCFHQEAQQPGSFDFEYPKNRRRYIGGFLAAHTWSVVVRTV